MFNFYSMLKALLLLGVILVFILILPQKLCVPFTSNCVILTPIIGLQNLIVFVGSFFMLYAFIFSILAIGVGIIKFIITHDYFRDIIMFLLTFDMKYYESLKSHFAGRKEVRFS